MPELPVIALSGPTASGKSSVAVRLARRLGEFDIPAEVVNADSMLVYRGMDIGTAKPTMAERAGVPHHLIDILDVTQTANVAAFQADARRCLTQCRSRGVLPILVGGSALYVHAILDEFDFPGTDPAVRGALEVELAQSGPQTLHARLAGLAPEAAAGIQPGNGRRIVRALEVITLTGSYSAALPTWSYALAGVVQYGLELPRAEMDRRIEERVQHMWEAGFVEEVRGLVPRGLRQGRTASRALGYRQILDQLEGQCSEKEAVVATVAGTKRFARKQLGWFRRDPRIVWFEAGDGAVESILSDLRSRLDRMEESR